MKKKELNLDEIEEVEQTPRRWHNHNHDHMHNHMYDNRRINNVPYERIHSNNSDYNQSNRINIDNDNIALNSDTNNSNHQHHRQHRRPHWSEFGCKQILLMSIFVFSLSIMFFSFIVNLILTIKQVVTPRIFIPSIIIIILSFIFSGGIVGTYIIPPNRRHPLKFRELILMRTIIPVVMLIISLIFLLIGADNIKSMKRDIHKAEDLCNQNKGLTMQEIYIKTNKTTNELIEKKNDFIYSFKNNLICFPTAKCVKLSQDTNQYLCNSQDFIMNDNSKKNCNILDINENINQFLNDIKSQKDAYLFLENCIDVNKNFLKSENKLFKCEAEEDLENIKFTKNLSTTNEEKIQSYLNKKVKMYNDRIVKGKEIIIKYEKSRNDYDLDCLTSVDYNISYLMINAYLFIFYMICIFWIIFGIYSMHNLINLGIEGKLDFLNDKEKDERNYIENDREVNQLINNNNK
jgi:hypothetical protein